MDFIVAVSITAPGQAQRKIRVGPEAVDKAEIGSR